MSIVEDMAAGLARAMVERAKKKSLGFPEPRAVFVVNKHAYMADVVRRTRDNPAAPMSGTEFMGVPVEFGPLSGWALEWRAP